MEYTFFGIQVLFQIGADTLRADLRAAIAEVAGKPELGIADKLIFWKKIAAIVALGAPRFDLGYWDYVEDAARAEEEFDRWTSELEAESATTDAEVGSAITEPYRLSAEKDYVALTCLFLLERGGNSDQTVADRCDLPEAEWSKRDTYIHLFDTIRMLSFASVRAD